MINFRYPYPYTPVTGKVLTSGQYADLKDLAGSVSIGLFDTQTYGVATGSGNGHTFFLGYSSTHTKDSIAKFHFGNTLPFKGHEFRGKDLLAFEYSKPSKTAPEVWTLGYDGTVGCNVKTCDFECGKTYGIEIEMTGSPVYRQWAKGLVHKVYVTTPCCATNACETGCPDTKIDCGWVMKKFAEKINNHVELSRAGIKTRYRTSDYAATAANTFEYCLCICDTGSVIDLTNVQTAVGSAGRVYRDSREGSTSCYKVCAEALPAPFQPTAKNTKAECGVCTSGTLVPGYQVFTVVRPISETTALATPVDQVAFATAVQTAYAGTGSKFLGFNSSAATVEIHVPIGTVPVALLADSLIAGITVEDSCTPNAIAPIVWSQCGEGYKVKRKLCLTLPRKECAAGNWSAEIEAFYATDPLYVAGSLVTIPGDACADTYNIEQWSDGCHKDACLAADTVNFEDIQGFNGVRWEVIDEEDLTFNPNRKCGLEISAELPEQYFSDCAMELNDFYETEPIRLQISWIKNEITGLDDACTVCTQVIRKKQAGSYSNQSGEAVLRKYIAAGAYLPYGGGDYDTPKMREVLDSNRRVQINRKTDYVFYYIRYETNKGKDRNFHQKAEIDEAVIFFEEGSQLEQDFVAAVTGVFSKFGVTLEERK